METLEDVIEKLNQVREVVNAQSKAIKSLNENNVKLKHKIELAEARISGIKMIIDQNLAKNKNNPFGGLF